MNHPFNDEELLTLFELAHINMRDDTPYCAECCDVEDSEIKDLHAKLNAFMNPEEAGATAS
ncbi:MAG: hypothetical protein ACXABY_12110 [Candidatus Thorarchaeota archaeon]|jgi:hypothetical protein